MSWNPWHEAHSATLVSPDLRANPWKLVANVATWLEFNPNRCISCRSLMRPLRRSTSRNTSWKAAILYSAGVRPFRTTVFFR